MTLARWDPWGEIAQMSRTMDRFLEQRPFRPARLFPWIGAEVFPLDMYDDGDAVVIKASLPGVRPEEVELSVTGDSLTVKAEARSEQEAKEEDYYRRERHYGAYQRVLTLPDGLAAEKADATFEHGVLTLRVPKAEEARPKTIKIGGAGTTEGKKS